MPTTRKTLSRRSLLHLVAGLSGLGLGVVHGKSSTPALIERSSTKHDFDFLHGEWHLRNRRLVCPRRGLWDEFDGEAICWKVLNGVGCIEEIRIPSRNYFVMALRLFDVDSGVWNDYWVNAEDGILTKAEQTGRFEKRIGTFCERRGDMDATPKKLVRSVWKDIRSNACSWRQDVSGDGGITWQTNWTMERKRIQTA